MQLLVAVEGGMALKIQDHNSRRGFPESQNG